MIRITDLRVSLNDDTPIAKLAAKKLKLPPQTVVEVVIVRKALDARRKNNISFVYSLDVNINVPDGKVLAALNGEPNIAAINQSEVTPSIQGKIVFDSQPVVVGMGPAGLMAAYALAKHGCRPLVLERGHDIDRRAADVAHFWHTGKLDAGSNVQFGEGGAGTFSDGKLTTRVQDPLMKHLLDILIAAGAPPEIKYLHKPHIGTDKLRGIVKNIREQIISMGGQVEFEARVTDVEIKEGRLTGLIINENRYITCSAVLLGIGHSARDTYNMLYNHGIAMEAKPFAVGVRIEHPQEVIDIAQYGAAAGHPKLGAADYSLVYQDKANNRTAYSFCMCPGGLVVAAASEPGGVVTNGMSLNSRASGIANSALVVNVNPADYGRRVLDGIEFQRSCEQLAFKLGGENYYAPVQTVGDFLAAKSGGRSFITKPSYRPGTTAVELRQCLPAFVTDTLAKALPDFGRKIHGFADPRAVMTGVETRTSAPVRIMRDSDYCSINTVGLYPIGEGAGYAGGIMSAALDGFNAALAVMSLHQQK